MSPKVLKALRGLYKIGGIYFPQSIFTTGPSRRVQIEKCRARFYCTNTGQELFTFDKDGMATPELYLLIRRFLMQHNIPFEEGDDYVRSVIITEQ